MWILLVTLFFGTSGTTNSIPNFKTLKECQKAAIDFTNVVSTSNRFQDIKSVCVYQTK